MERDQAVPADTVRPDDRVMVPQLAEGLPDIPGGKARAFDTNKDGTVKTAGKNVAEGIIKAFAEIMTALHETDRFSENSRRPLPRCPGADDNGFGIYGAERVQEVPDEADMEVEGKIITDLPGKAGFHFPALRIPKKQDDGVSIIQILSPALSRTQ
jgi:hypothetical protein